MTAHHRRLLLKKWSRSFHIYLSMLGLLLIFFFAVTGILLNHEEWFTLNQPQVRKADCSLPVRFVAERDKLAIVECLRRQFGAIGALDTFETQDDQMQLVFKSPGRRTEAVINRADGRAEVTLETSGALRRITELHRGTDTGRGWRLIIDAAAILQLAGAGTGIVLWLLVPKWRPLGLGALAVCAVICLVVYLALVP